MLKRPGGYVYFVQATDSGLIKIGRTQKVPEKRLRALRATSPVPLVGLGWISAPEWFEARLHERFASLLAYNEWFHPGDRLLYFIRRWAKPWDSATMHETPQEACLAVAEWAKSYCHYRPERPINLVISMALGNCADRRNLMRNPKLHIRF